MLSDTEESLDIHQEFVKVSPEGDLVLACDAEGQGRGCELVEGLQQTLLVLLRLQADQLIHQVTVQILERGNVQKLSHSVRKTVCLYIL